MAFGRHHWYRVTHINCFQAFEYHFKKLFTTISGYLSIFESGRSLVFIWRQPMTQMFAPTGDWEMVGAV